jgi:hypothetical protein
MDNLYPRERRSYGGYVNAGASPPKGGFLRRAFRIAIVAGAIVAGLVVLIRILPSTRTEDTVSDRRDLLKRRLDDLRSLPYTSRTAPVMDTTLAGVTVHDPERAYRGYNLYCSRTTPYAHLMNMSGEIVHSWTYATEEPAIWEHAVMLENGDLVAILKMKSLVRLDWRSNLLWEKAMQVHHEVTPLPDGTLYAIAREIQEHRGLQIRFPAIVHLSPDGEEIERWYTYDHLDEIKGVFDQRSFLDTILDSLLAEEDSVALYATLSRRRGMHRFKLQHEYYDYLHLNTITLLPDTPLGRRDKRFQAGNLLICFRNVNQIGVLDGETRQVIWAWGEGELEWPHHPTMLENGNILIFDNGVSRRYSRILELNPLTQEIVWEYVADPPSSFFTSQRGSSQRLPNGNTLICDGNGGRAFEVSLNGEILWEWLNPNMEKGRREQVYRVTRIPSDIVDALIGAPEERTSSNSWRRGDQ